jgi:acyl carrier protein
MDAADIKPIVKQYILDEFLPGEDPDELTDEVRLFSEGILDSLASLKLVAFLEERFDISIEAHEVDEEYLDTLSSITALVVRKLGSAAA